MSTFNIILDTVGGPPQPFSDQCAKPCYNDEHATTAEAEQLAETVMRSPEEREKDAAPRHN